MSKIHLPNVTLFSLDDRDPQELLRVAEICQRDIIFGDVVLLTNKVLPGNTREEKRISYSQFMIKELVNHFDTSHVLVFQRDGFIQNPQAWDKRWMRLDYIGSPWEFYSEMNCGNGGFSLRSKFLCEMLSKDTEITEFMPEDDRICRKYRPYLEQKYGIKYGTLEQARAFGIEAWGMPAEKRKYTGQFGYHGFGVLDLPIPPKR